jgi:hypothetical protein
MSGASHTHVTVPIKAVYAHLDAMLTGIDRLKRANLGGFDVVSPLPRHEILELVYEGKPSPVRWWTLSGACAGITSGFLITSLTMSKWPMVNPGGKPVVSLPPFAIIMFECTILAGALFTLAGMFVHSGLPAIFLEKSIQDPRYSDDKFGIVFCGANETDRDRIVEILRASGAIEVTTGDDTHYEVPNA